MGTRKAEIGAAVSSDRIRLAVSYNDALDRCTRTGGENIDEVMDFFDDDAVRIGSRGEQAIGKAAIRESFLHRSAQLSQIVELRGIELWGDLVVCRVERWDSTHHDKGWEHHLRILLVKDGKIKWLNVIADPEEDRRLKPRG